MPSTLGSVFTVKNNPSRRAPLQDVEAGDRSPQGHDRYVGDHWTDVPLVALQ